MISETYIAFLACTIILSVSCLVYFLAHKTIQKSQSYVFLTLIVSIVFSAVMDIISNYIQHVTVATGFLYMIQYLTEMFYFLSHFLLAPLYALYIILVNGSGMRKKALFYVIFFLPSAFVEFIVLINPWTSWLFTYDKYGAYQRGPMMGVCYTVAGLYLAISVYFMIRYRKAVGKVTNIALWYFFSFSLAGIIVQMLVPILMVELFAESVSLMGVMLMVENEEELLDPATKVYNRRAFVEEVRRLVETGNRFAVICIHMTNFRFYARLMSYNDMSEALRMMTNWLKGIDPDVRVYRVSTSGIVLAHLYHTEEQVDELVKQIAERYNDGWVYGTLALELNTILRVAKVPEDLSDTEMLLELAEENDEIEHPGVRIQRGQELYYITRRAQVENALRRAIKENRFEVYYQPIWNAETDRIEIAEALLRLRDPELGNLAPDEIIPIAERNGLIAEVGLRVFDEVCAFLAEQRTKRLGIKYIEINLSIYQLITGHTQEKFDEILNKYRINPKQINFEITESASLSVGSSPLGAIEELKEEGYTFSLDDYGTGYSNMTYIIGMKFLNIKSDKGLLWDADKNEDSRMILGDTIRMLRRMGVNVVQEGVETKEQLDFVLDAGANLIQGYYFSKPLRQDAFVDFLESFQGRAAMEQERQQS